MDNQRLRPDAESRAWFIAICAPVPARPQGEALNQHQRAAREVLISSLAVDNMGRRFRVEWGPTAPVVPVTACGETCSRSSPPARCRVQAGESDSESGAERTEPEATNSDRRGTNRLPLSGIMFSRVCDANTVRVPYIM